MQHCGARERPLAIRRHHRLAGRPDERWISYTLCMLGKQPPAPASIQQRLVGPRFAKNLNRRHQAPASSCNHRRQRA
jgi:hypothetical protein